MIWKLHNPIYSKVSFNTSIFKSFNKKESRQILYWKNLIQQKIFFKHILQISDVEIKDYENLGQ